MENTFLITKCMLIPNEGSSLKEEYDITLEIQSLTITKVIESPSISMTISFIDVDQVIGRKGITGGEYVDLIVKVDDEDAEDFKIMHNKQKMILNSVRDMVTESNKQVATLEFVSVETLVNETARVNKKYTGNISDIVLELLVGDTKGIKTKRNIICFPVDEKLGDENVKKDRATNSYSFVGNLKETF